MATTDHPISLWHCIHDAINMLLRALLAWAVSLWQATSCRSTLFQASKTKTPRNGGLIRGLTSKQKRQPCSCDNQPGGGRCKGCVKTNRPDKDTAWPTRDHGVSSRVDSTHEASKDVRSSRARARSPLAPELQFPASPRYNEMA